MTANTTPREQVAAYLERFGYMDSAQLATFGFAQRKSFARAGDVERALAAFQRNFGLDPTGQLDDATAALMSRKRCGFPDVGQFVLTGNKWDKTQLTYRINNFTPDIREAPTRVAFAAAFNLWRDKCNLEFAATTGAADIEILFGNGEHGDGVPFDGASGVLAHAFFPGQGAISGDMHFDEAERWSVDGSGIDLRWVAAHEAGHSLGLAHSTVQGSLMYPFYSGAGAALHADDIAGIQTLYGARAVTPPPTPPTTPPTTPSVRYWTGFRLELTDNLGAVDHAVGRVDPPSGV